MTENNACAQMGKVNGAPLSGSYEEIDAFLKKNPLALHQFIDDLVDFEINRRARTDVLYKIFNQHNINTREAFIISMVLLICIRIIRRC